MWIGLRIAEHRVDPVDEPIAHGVLHVLRLVVNFVPGELERFDQELLDQPVPSHHARASARPAAVSRTPSYGV